MYGINIYTVESNSVERRKYCNLKMVKRGNNYENGMQNY